MTETIEIARGILRILEIYVWIGIAVAGVFLVLGIERVDPAARRAYAFRLLIVPGLVVLWPVVLVRWLSLVRKRS